MSPLHGWSQLDTHVSELGSHVPHSPVGLVGSSQSSFTTQSMLHMGLSMQVFVARSQFGQSLPQSWGPSHAWKHWPPAAAAAASSTSPATTATAQRGIRM